MPRVSEFGRAVVRRWDEVLSEPTPLDPEQLATRARVRAAGHLSPEPAADPNSFAAALSELVETAFDYEEPWVLPDKARLRGSRSAALRVLKVFTDRQQELDSTLVSAVVLLVGYCRSLEAQIDELAVRVRAAEAAAREDGSDR
jgi:hypothetical protein